MLVLTVAALTLGPTPSGLQDAVRDLAEAVIPGRPGFPRRTQVEVVANGLLLWPLGVLLPAAVPKVSYWVLVVACSGLGAGIESAQTLLLPGRHATVRDVCLNSTGALLGLLTARLLLRRPARPA